MKLNVTVLLLATCVVQLNAAGADAIQSDIDAVFAGMRGLKAMQARTPYTLPTRGVQTTGTNDDFLRRRTAAEVKTSGLSCGCGDYAVVFIEQIRPRGYETLLVDSAQVSLSSLWSTFSGHAVVAIRPTAPANAAWWLVDSTARKVISREWTPSAKSFVASGAVYWIGYCGAPEDYPVRSPSELKRFYADTLATVPADVFNRTLIRFTFTVDPSLVAEDGRLLNPRISRLAEEQERLLARYRIVPQRQVEIRLTRGGDDALSDLRYADDGWVSRVGLKSACSPSLLSYFETQVRRRDHP